MATIKVPGFKQYNTGSNPRSIDPLDVTEALNMVWDGNRVKCRNGSSKFKNSDQWSGNYVIKIVDFKKLTDAFFYVVVVLNDGRMFYIRSDNSNYAAASATWTEILSTSSTSPALASVATVQLFGFNNKLFVANNTNNIYYFDGSSNQLTLVTDPTNLGSANAIAFIDKTSRLVILDDNGRNHFSVINDGTDFTGAGSGSLNYARVEGLKATSLTPYGDDVLVTTEDPLTLKFITYYLTGIQFYDPAVIGSDTDQFQTRKLNSISGLIGNTSQEIADDTVGLTPRGFIGVSKSIVETVLTERDYISFPIKEIIQQLNFTQSRSMSSVIDYVNGLYLCAVPYGADINFANIILVYDFLRSSPDEKIYRWSVWTFPWGDISVIGRIAGLPYIADTQGNIYKINDPSTSFADDGQAINYVVKTAAFGGGDLDTEKDFGDLNMLITDMSDDFNLTVNEIIDGVLISNDIDGTPIQPIRVELPLGGILYDTPGVLYDDFNFYDASGSDQRVVTLKNRGGRATSMQWIFSTNTTGKSWGLGGLWSTLEAIEQTNEAGANNSGSI